MLKSDGYVLYIGIGEQDAREIKEVFGRGQNFGEWNNSKLNQGREIIKQAGFRIIFGQDFYYHEYYLTDKDLDIFLQGVPIFPDYNTEKDKGNIDTYINIFKKEQGIDLPRHRYVIVAVKE